MKTEVETLLETAKSVSIGLAKVAATKPNETPLQSNAQTFRGTAYVLTALANEISRSHAYQTTLLATLRRVANLEVRDAANLIQANDWRAIVEELQVISQEALAPGTGGGSQRAPRKDATPRSL